MYAQVKANIDKLDKKGKQRILQLLQKSIQQSPAGAAPAGAAPAAPSVDAAADQGEKGAAGGAMGAMAQQLGAAKPAANTMANAPVSKTNVAKPGNPNAAPVVEPTAAPAATTTKKTGGRVKGQLSQDPRAVKRREANAAKQQGNEPKKQAAPAQTQAEIDADRERIMGVTSDSIVRRQPMMAESFSLFRKRT
jgi:hypothetical protein